MFASARYRSCAVHWLQSTATLVVPLEAGLVQNEVLCGGAYAVDIVMDPDHGTLIEQTYGSFEYTPDPAFPETVSFTYSLKENNVEVGQALVTIWVISDDCTAMAFGDGFSAVYETTLTVPGPGYVANDTLDCQLYEPFLFQIQSGPTHGTLVNHGDGGFDPGYVGQDSFTYDLRADIFSFPEILATAAVVIDVGDADGTTTTTTVADTTTATTTVADATTTTVVDTTTTTVVDATTTTVADATTTTVADATTTTTEAISGSTTPELATTVPDSGPETSVPGQEPSLPLPLPPGIPGRHVQRLAEPDRRGRAA